jgi:two-component system, response regulator, stage 0 sporulation protein F
MKKNDDVLNAQEAADFLGAHVETVRRLARIGDVPAYKIGKDWRFRKEALINWAETQSLRRKPPCVLVIDDDDSILKLMRRFLEADGYQVCLASDGSEGLAWLNRKSVNLILLDLKMPGMNGPEFLKEMRKMNEYLPVIVATGYPDGDLMAEAIHYGPFTLLAKPIDRKQLARTVEMALNGAREAHTG